VSLALPVFCVALRKNNPGSFDIGFIDKKKVVGSIYWVDTRPGDSYWTIRVTGVTVGGQFKLGKINGILDTGTHLWTLPTDFVDLYYSKVEGATLSSDNTTWTFPCTAKLPDIGVQIGGKIITVVGSNMNFTTRGDGSCLGGLQSADGSDFVFGIAFLQHLYVIHEQAVNRRPRIGLAHSQYP
jgi:aspergillopepsin I